jgi:hypothetical protein
VVANSIVNQDRLIGGEAFSPGLASDVRGRQTTGQLLAGEHAGDAGQLARFGYVDAAQARALRNTFAWSMFGITWSPA